jgi:hypothetical protein
MKVLSILEAQPRLASVCAEAAAGESIRLRLDNGALLELTPVPAMSPPAPPLSDEALAAGYGDPEWASFENRCGKASD